MAEQIGEITILNGSAVAEGPDGVRELTLGSPIYNDDVITTESKSAVEITFTDGALLSQGANSQVHLDDYVFDPDNDAGEVTMNLIQGTFRSVTGQIVDMNPEGFKIDTPNTTIGIRGTTTGHTVGDGGEETHVVLDFVDKPVVFTSRATGVTQIISRDGYKVVSGPSGISPVERASARDLSQFEELSTRSMQESASDQEGDDDEPTDDADENADGENADGENTDGENPEGNEEGTGEPEPEPEPEPEQRGITGNPHGLIGGGQIAPIEEPQEEVKEAPKEKPTTKGPEEPGPPKEEEDQPEDTPEEFQPTINGDTIDLSKYKANLTASLANSPDGEYKPTDGDGESGTIDHSIQNLIGAAHYANDLTGNDQDNQLTGGSKDDHIHAGMGDDTVIGGAGDDTLDGGSGTMDIVSYANDFSSDGTTGVSVNLAGGYAIDGWGDHDHLTNFEGVIGSDYNDTFFFDANGAGAGTTIDGGDGVDVIGIEATADLTGITSITNIEKLEFIHSGTTATFGVTNFDASETGTIIGSAGADVLAITAASETADSLYSFSGLTFESGWDSNDKLEFTGSDHQDSVEGSSANDFIKGGLGNDAIKGSTGEDTIWGEADNDAIDGGSGADSLLGGAGNDSFIGGEGTDFIDGGAGTGDWVSYQLDPSPNETTTGVTIDLTNNTGKDGWGDTDTLLNLEGVLGSANDDWIQGNENASDSLVGGAGDDTLIGNGGIDALTGQEGDDVFSFNANNTGVGTVIDGGDDTDIIAIEDTTDLTGLASMTNVEKIKFVNSATTATFEAADINFTQLNTIIGSAGADVLAITAASATGNAMYDLSGLTFESGWDATDKIEFTGSDHVDIIQGSSGVDVIKGGLGDDTISGGDGNDTIMGEGGNDTIMGGDGVDSLDGGAGTADIVSYALDPSPNANTNGVTIDLWAGTGQDGWGNTDSLANFEGVIGSVNNDWIRGNLNADDTLYGGDGNDTIIGKGGVDALYGQGGDDTFTFNSHDAGTGTTIDGGTGTDAIGIGDTTDLTGISSITNMEKIEFLSSGRTATFEAQDVLGGQISTIKGYSGVDILQLTAASATADGTYSMAGLTFEGNWDASDKIEFIASSYNDDITGSSANDAFVMGANFDSNDTINGGAGSDTITADQYASGNFTNIINVEHLIFTDKMYISSISTDLIETGGTLIVDSSATTVGSYFDGRSETDNIKFIGSTINDSLWGGSGDDTFDMTAGSGDINGGAGDDTFIMGSDVVYGDIIDGADGEDSISLTDNNATSNDLGLVKNMELVTFGASDVVETTYDALVTSGKTCVIDASAAISFNFDGTSESNGNFSIIGSAGNNTIMGGAGDDTIQGGNSLDTLDGGLGNNVLSYAGSVGAVTVDMGNSTATGGDATGDSISWSSFTGVFGGAGDDILIGDGANNLIGGGAGADDLTGGIGNDTFIFNTGDVVVGESITGSGSDILFANTSTDFTAGSFTGISGIQIGAEATATFDETQTHNTNFAIQGEAGSAQVLAVDIAATSIFSLANLTFSDWDGTEGDHIKIDGSSGGDNITGSAENDSIWGGDGNDVINGGLGDDTFVSSTGDDDFNGGGGTNSLSYQNWNTYGLDVDLDAGTVDKDGDATTDDTFSNIDVFYGTNQSGFGDTIMGSSTSATYIYGRDGDDEITYAGQADTLDGGYGNDTFIFSQNVIAGTEIKGCAGLEDRIKVTNHVDFSSITSIEDVEQLEITNGKTATFKAADITDEGWQLFGGDVAADSETLIVQLANGGDTLNLSNLSFSTPTDPAGNQSSWTVGKDSITINGGDGADNILGSDWGERIQGGLGADTMDGGAGSDTFHYGTILEVGDTINNFSHNDDQFSLSSSDFGGYTGTLNASDFFASQADLDASSQTGGSFFFESDILYYDADGAGGNAGVAIATVTLADGPIDDTDITFV